MKSLTASLSWTFAATNEHRTTVAFRQIEFASQNSARLLMYCQEEDAAEAANSIKPNTRFGAKTIAIETCVDCGVLTATVVADTGLQ